MKLPLPIATALALSVGLSACGSTSVTGSGAAPAASATPAVATSSSSPSASAGGSGAKVGDTVDFAAVAARSATASKAKGTAHMTMTLEGQQLVESDVDYRTSRVREQIALGGQQLDVVLVDKKVYIGGAFAKSVGAPTPWVQVDPQGTDPLSRSMAGALGSLSSAGSNPTDALAGLTGVTGKVTAVSPTSTTYAVTFSKEQVAQLAKKSASVLQSLGQAVPTTGLGYEFTISRAGLPLTMVMATGGKTVTMAFSAWGKPVDVSAPPASQVTPTSRLK